MTYSCVTVVLSFIHSLCCLQTLIGTRTFPVYPSCVSSLCPPRSRRPPICTQAVVDLHPYLARVYLHFCSTLDPDPS